MSAELNANLKKLDTDELIYKINNSMLTKEAHQVAIRVLMDRGVNANSLKQKPEEYTQAKTYGIESEEDKELKLQGEVRDMNELKIASLWSRIGGALIDLIIVVVISAVICFVWGIFIGLSGSERFLTQRESDALWNGRGMLVGLLVDCAYCVAMMTSAKQSTYGQRAVGVKIVKDNGTAIDFGTAIGRWIVSIFSSVLLKVGYLIAVFTTNKKTLHDLVAGTIVVDVEQEENAGYSQQQPEANQTVKSKSMSHKNNLKTATDNTSRVSEGNVLTNSTMKKVHQVLQIDEDSIWAEVLNEYETDKRNKGLWTRLFVESNGDEDKIKIAYLKIRANQMLEEKKKEQQALMNEIKRIEFLEEKEKEKKPQQSYEFGMKIYKGYDDTPPNPAEAFPYLYEAAIGGVANAQFNLSLMYWKGDGIETNKAEAYAWSRIAANAIFDAKQNVKHYSKNMSIDEILESDKLAKKYVDLIQS